MQLTQDYERWFRDTGQFLEPAGDLSRPQSLELLKQWGCAVWNEAEDRMAEADKKVVDAEEETEKAKDGLENLKIDINNLVINSDETDEQTLVKIQELVKV